MNRIDREALRIVIPLSVSAITAYYTVKHYDKINFALTKIYEEIMRLF